MQNILPRMIRQANDPPGGFFHCSHQKTTAASSEVDSQYESAEGIKMRRGVRVRS
jgi:hypothetical protein